MAQPSDLILLPTGLSRDDLAPQARVAYELEDAGIPADKIALVFSRVRGSETERAAARSFLKRGQLNALAGEVRELPTIRLAMNSGRAASETSKPHINRETLAVVEEIATKASTKPRKET